MNAKSINKMMKANRANLNPKEIKVGLSRFKHLGTDECFPDNSTVYEPTNDGRILCRVQFWYKGKHGMICRIGRDKEEAQAKLGKALPLKRLGIS